MHMHSSSHLRPGSSQIYDGAKRPILLLSIRMAWGMSQFRSQLWLPSVSSTNQLRNSNRAESGACLELFAVSSLTEH